MKNFTTFLTVKVFEALSTSYPLVIIIDHLENNAKSPLIIENSGQQSFLYINFSVRHISYKKATDREKILLVLF